MTDSYVKEGTGRREILLVGVLRNQDKLKVTYMPAISHTLAWSEVPNLFGKWGEVRAGG